MGNSEMTKYMAAGAFQDLTANKSDFDNSNNWLAGLAASARYAGKLYGVPYYAGSRVVTYRTDLFKSAGISKLPTSLAGTRRRQEARREEQLRGLLAGLHRRHGLVRRHGLRLRLRGKIAITQGEVDRHARQTGRPRRTRSVQEVLRCRVAG